MLNEGWFLNANICSTLSYYYIDATLNFVSVISKEIKLAILEQKIKPANQKFLFIANSYKFFRLKVSCCD